ncbi:MAG: TonB-dependent receptor [Chloroflexi bacterium]|nr:TonB-dependent receptor [Chloroflexota bacterium]
MADTDGRENGPPACRIRFEADDRFLTDGDQSGGRTLEAVSPSIGLTFWPVHSDAWITYANVATSFETPTTTELVNRPGGGGGFNPGLDPQKATSYEIGMRGATGLFRYDVALYYARVRDELISFRDPIDEDRDFFRNAGKSDHRGVEFALSAGPWRGLSATGSYTFTGLTFVDFRTDDDVFDDNRLPGVPRNRGGLRLRYLPTPGWTFQWETRFEGSYFANDANTVEVEKDGKKTKLRAKSFILAMGSSVIMLKIPGLKGGRDDGVWTSDDAVTAPFVPKSMLVLGGGAHLRMTARVLHPGP